ncbi:hypothetical protein JCM21714_4111 [Gracilibacillus boraciitolerans JCM 21714]|uniref:Uncharacterized protein n=1 Tax=Gracilibacillus boraciitolerans JCM 21714 TaxID=1298598 RepID=W4VP29_9BACI|nr:hypothetical protein JCM21714_4111 [Gracilibacillus boraciitolerans JCM 21714]
MFPVLDLQQYSDLYLRKAKNGIYRKNIYGKLYREIPSFAPPFIYKTIKIQKGNKKM